MTSNFDFLIIDEDTAELFQTIKCWDDTNR
ncbi:hypothetical protein D8812_01970 [Streptococcus gordonii]|nr:hypothetical protein D8812_01970 [Streptococcus gordonii]